MGGLQRTKSDTVSIFHINDDDDNDNNNKNNYNPLSPAPGPAPALKLTTLSEIELAKCECCGMSEECTAEYIEEMRERFEGKLVCGLCAEAVKEEMEKNGGRREEAVEEHMRACVKFNKVGKAYPVLNQAEVFRKILKKSCTSVGANQRKMGGGGGISRSSSCIPCISDELQDKLRF